MTHDAAVAKVLAEVDERFYESVHATADMLAAHGATHPEVLAALFRVAADYIEQREAMRDTLPAMLSHALTDTPHVER